MTSDPEELDPELDVELGGEDDELEDDLDDDLDGVPDGFVVEGEDDDADGTDDADADADAGDGEGEGEGDDGEDGDAAGVATVVAAEEPDDFEEDIAPVVRVPEEEDDAPARQSGEFVCSRCHLVKRESQLAIRSRKVCRDCA